MTGQIVIAAVVGVADTLIKAVFFYFHERVWDSIEYGKDELDAR